MAFVEVFSDDRVIYAVTGDGSLLWYRDDLGDGTNGANAERGWAPRSGNQIGFDWDIFMTVFSGGDGIIYAIRETGELVWYRDDLRDGSNGANADAGWAPGSGNQIGFGWDMFTTVFSGGDGIIYGITPAGELLWYRDDLRDGSNGANAERGWAPGSGSQIGFGWDTFAAVFSGGDGIIYGIARGGELLWYRDDLRDGSNGAAGEEGWAPGSGSAIGLGWSTEPRLLISGYASPVSVAPGDTIEVKLSARTESSCIVSVVRLRDNGDGSVGVAVGERVETVVTRQAIPVDAWQSGCGWETTVSFDVGPAWRSGIYSARAITLHGTVVCDAVFVLRPADSQRSNLLLLANTNCWNAYNAWGGVSNYTGYDEVVTLSFDRPNPAATPNAWNNGGYTANHLTAAEIWVSTWLEDAGYEFDVCSDRDFHNGDPDPTGYRAVILSTHPEYWSQTMAQRLWDYVAGGGRVLYWGGNGIFRQVEFADDGLSMTTGSTPAWFCGNAWPGGPKPRELLGVAYEFAHDTLYPARCGYVVARADHFIFAGTGLVDGDVVGRVGRNGGGACGWEVDCATDLGEGNGAAPPNEQILGRGELVTADGYTGHMSFYDNDAGGFVFAIGSITFGGSLPEDLDLQAIARNALNACLA